MNNPIQAQSTIVLINGTEIHTTAEPEIEADDMMYRVQDGTPTIRVARVMFPGVDREPTLTWVAIAAVVYIQPFNG